MGKQASARGRSALLEVVHSGRVTLHLRDARNRAEAALSGPAAPSGARAQRSCHGRPAYLSHPNQISGSDLTGFGAARTQALASIDQVSSK
jgi:hypothetical protein